MTTAFYNTQHSPVGAQASFTLGMRGKSGGLGIGLAGPALENFWIGYEDADQGVLRCLPFFEGANYHEEERFGLAADSPSGRWPVVAFADNEVQRHLDAGRDTWQAGGLTFSIFTQVPKLEDPQDNERSELKLGLIPGLLCELALDNSRGSKAQRVFIGWQGGNPQWAMRVLRSQDMVGMAQGGQNGFFGAAIDGWMASLAFSPTEALERIRDTALGQNRLWGLGICGMLAFEVEAGQKKCCPLAVPFFQNGVFTTGRRCRPWYNKWWDSLEDVAWELLVNLKSLRKRAEQASSLCESWGLSEERRWMLVQALHSYYGSTLLLEDIDRAEAPLWVVNEGEYRMLNTLDLTVDHIFFEMAYHPWTVRSVLEQFRKRHSYKDALGISFAHDMGVGGAFAPVGRSAYELAGQQGCFSFMTAEELVNYILCAISYARVGGGHDWLDAQGDLLSELYASLSARCKDESGNPTGVVQKDSSLCAGGSEITTYDSLDPALGRARMNLYLAVKCWAAWIGLYQMFERKNNEAAASTSWDNAILAGQTVMQAVDPATGLIPALLDGSCRSAILPAIEGLVFPAWWGDTKMVAPDGPFASLLRALRRHTEVALESGKCVFPDGGLRISETSNNSWLSKLYLWQAVCERVLLWQWPAMDEADRAHRAWLQDSGNALYAWSDQYMAGKVCGSRYYPRGVTAVLWVPEFWQE